MKASRFFFFSGFFITVVLTLVGYGPQVSAQTNTFFGETVAVGGGTARTYVELKPDGSPVSLGVTFTSSALQNLPTTPNNTGRCFDLNGNGTIDMPEECLGDYEWSLTLPKELAQRSKLPFQWVGLNWNPEGHRHPAPTAWAVPHWDFHFYLTSREDRRTCTGI